MKHLSMTLFTAALALAATACTKEPSGFHPREGEEVRIPISLSCEPLDTETEGETRSSHSAAALTTVTNVNYYVFRNGTLAKQEYFDDASEFAVTLPSATLKYNLYILANVGELTIPEGTAEESMPTAVHFDYGSKSNYFGTISDNGFPMSNVVRNFSASSATQYTLRRLVHTLYVKMNTEELISTRMTFTGVQIKQAPRDIYPFADGSKATAVMDGDAANLSQSDIERLNRGETVTLYLLENMRGQLLPGNTSWRTKIPSRISSSQERSRASYIEMTAKVETATATYENNIYRAYLGLDATNFDVERSTYFLLNNNFTNDMVVDEDWRLEADDPTITAQLCFADTRFTYDTAYDWYKDATGDIEYRPFQEVDSFYTMNGFTAVYYIYRSNPDIAYTLTVDKASTVEPYVSYRRSRIDDHFEALMINTDMPVSTTEYYTESGVPSQNGTKDVVFTISSADGLITDRMTVKVLYKQLGLRFHYDNVGKAVATTDDGILNMYMCNPLKMRVKVNITGTVNGYVSYKPNGTAWGSKSQSPEVHIKTGGTYSVNVGAVRMDTYQDNTAYGGSVVNGRNGFYQYFESIWNTTGWDSYSKLNGSNGYHKHAHPTSMSLAVTLSYDSPNSRRLKPDNGLMLPVYFLNNELLTHSSGAGYGAGTDWGFEWDQFDNAENSSYDRYRFLKHTSTPNQSAYSYNFQVPVGVTINGTNKWRSENPKIPLSVTYGSNYFSDLGF